MSNIVFFDYVICYMCYIVTIKHSLNMISTNKIDITHTFQGATVISHQETGLYYFTNQTTCFITFLTPSTNALLVLNLLSFYLEQDFAEDFDNFGISAGFSSQRKTCDSSLTIYASTNSRGPSLTPPLCQYQKPMETYYIPGESVTIWLRTSISTRTGKA